MGRPTSGGAKGTFQSFFHQCTCVGCCRSRADGGRTGMCACVFVGLKLLGISYRRVLEILSAY